MSNCNTGGCPTGNNFINYLQNNYISHHFLKTSLHYYVKRKFKNVAIAPSILDDSSSTFLFLFESQQLLFPPCLTSSLESTS